MRVQIRGKTYLTVVIAANALGVEPNTIYCAAERGTLDWVGLGTGKGKPFDHVEAAPKKEVVLLGGRLRFRSRTEAAKALGVDRSHMAKVLAGKYGSEAEEKLNLRAMRYLSKMNRSSRA